MLTRVANLALALLGSLLFLFPLIGGQSPTDAMSVIVALVMFCWLAGAIALFFKRGLAWPANLLGLGVSFSGCFTAFAVSLKLAPTSQDPTEGVG
jgi:hypothetical protein